jgi:hypothetical protein
LINENINGLILSDEFKEKLINEGINPLDVKSFSTFNNKISRLVITRIILVDGTEKNLVEPFVWYAAKKDKTF